MRWPRRRRRRAAAAAGGASERVFELKRFFVFFLSSHTRLPALFGVCGASLRSGPAPPSDPNAIDIVDEALSFFKANCLFRNFEVKVRRSAQADFFFFVR